MAIVINSAWDAELFKRQKEEARKHINSAWDAQMFYQTYGGHGEAGDWGSAQWVKRHATSGDYYTYNPLTRAWNAISLSSLDLSSFSSSMLGELSLSADSSGVLSQVGVVNSSTDAKTDSRKKAEKDYIEVEFNTLVGELNLIPTKDNIKIKPNTTINLEGLGKFLSGLYFVSEVRKSMNQDGYSLTVTVFKNGFGTLKNMSLTQTQTPNERPSEIDILSNAVSSHLKVGIKVRIVGDEAVYSNEDEGVVIPDYIKQKDFVIEEISNDNLRAYLAPLKKWTYTKFLKPI